MILKEQTFEAGCKMSEHVKKEGNRRAVEIDIIYKVGSRNRKEVGIGYNSKEV